MYKLPYVDTRNMPREEWLQHRRNSIGGSDAAAILGMHKHATAMTVWGDKTGRIPPEEENEAMRQGRDLEYYVAERWCEVTGKKVHRLNRMIRNLKYPYSHADIDRKVANENAGLECKTLSAWDAEDKLDIGEIPPHYYVQCVHYIAVTGADRWYLGILVLGRGFYEFTIERDEGEISALMQAEADFWENHVLPDEPPPADGENPTTDALERMYPDACPADVRLDDDVLNRYQQHRAERDAAEKSMETAKQEIMLQMQEAEAGHGDVADVKWKKHQRTTYDVKKFMKEHPEFDMTPYTKVTDYRIFEVK